MLIEVWVQRHGQLKMEEFDDPAEADAYIQENESWGWQECEPVDECTCEEI